MKPNPTPDRIREAVQAYRDVHGKNPVYTGGDATSYFGYPETWAAIGQCLDLGLRGMPGGSSLHKFLVEQGFAKPIPTKPRLSNSVIRRSVLKYTRANSGKMPTIRSGDATPYFGYPDTWKSVHQALAHGYRGMPGGSSLSKFLSNHGFKPHKPRPKNKPPLTMDAITIAIQRYRKMHRGNPSDASGDATPYFDHPETWTAIGQCLRIGFRGLPGGSSLSNLCKELDGVE